MTKKLILNITVLSLDLKKINNSHVLQLFLLSFLNSNPKFPNNCPRSQLFYSKNIFKRN